jgi:regulator of sigma E protease
VKRSDSEVAVNVALKDADESQLGVQVESSSLVRVPFYLAPVTALKETYEITATTFRLLGSFVADVFKTGKVSDEVGGPVKIYLYTGMAVKAGFIFVLQFIALLSVNLALINILPIPALDGSKIFLTILEKLFGKRVIKESTENLIHTIGFAILIIFILLVTFKDLNLSEKIMHIFK